MKNKCSISLSLVNWHPPSRLTILGLDLILSIKFIKPDAPSIADFEGAMLISEVRN